MHLDEGGVQHHRFDLFDDLGLGAHIEQLKLHHENCLFLGLCHCSHCVLACSCCVICACARACTSCGRSSGTCCGESNFLDVQTRVLYCCKSECKHQSVSQSCCRIDLIGFFVTLRGVTRSVAWRSIRVDMSLTSLCRVGSVEAE